MGEPRPALCFLLALAAACAPGCRGCRDAEPKSEAGGDKPAALPFARAEPLRFEPLSTARGFGLPAGCRLELPIRSATLPAGMVRFVAAESTLGELAVATADGDGGDVRSAWLTLSPPRADPLPWTRLDEPPALARAEHGVVAARETQPEGALASALLWRGTNDELELVQGDQLSVSDLACDGPSCALLTSLARRASTPGATLSVGRARDAQSLWKRFDVEADPGVAWKPFAIVDFDGRARTAWLALVAKKQIGFWHWAGGRTEPRGTLPAPHGVYDVVFAAAPLVVAPAAPPDAPCGRDDFPIAVTALGSEPFQIQTQAPPDSVIARPIGEGAIVLWVAPVSCRLTSRTVVHAALLGKDGRPTGSVMSVADATGFAVATRGDELSLWLRTSQGIAWMRGTCAAVTDASAPPSGRDQ
jgi:hypothetical protein